MKLHPEPDNPFHVHSRTAANLDLPIAVRINEGHSGGGMVGHASRNAITGKAILHNATIAETSFCVLDLWERDALYGAPEDLVQDPYLFKACPLTLRTWIYHYYFHDKEMMVGTKGPGGDNAIMHRVLSRTVIDCKVIAGRWSSACCSFPATFFAIFAADMVLAWMCGVISAFNVAVSKLTNTPGLFRRSRAISFPFRLAFLILVFVRLAERAERGAVVILSFLVIIGFLLTDLIAGDLMKLLGHQAQCKYEVLDVLPGRIFICKRFGAAFVKDPDLDGREISQAITGLGYFDELVLIVEVRGIICQLKPLSKEDWVLAWEERAETERPIGFIGLDVFNKQRATADELNVFTKGASKAGRAAALIEQLKKGGGTAPSPDSEFLE